MTYLKTACYSACLAATIIFVGCSSNKELHSNPSLSRNAKQNPKFLNDIELGGNGKTMSTSTLASSMKNGKHYDPAISNVLQLKYAKMLQVVPQAISNITLYSFIDEWYGVRYRMGGNDKSGIDCSAFVQRLYEQVFGTNVVRTAFEQFNNCGMVWNVDSIKEGDLVFFRTHGGRISHVGIYLMNNYFVHASSSRGVAISSLNEDYWSRKYAGAGQIPRG
jgi:cell wall-associated NlpC family hydrolase